MGLVGEYLKIFKGGKPMNMEDVLGSGVSSVFFIYHLSYSGRQS